MFVNGAFNNYKVDLSNTNLPLTNNIPTKFFHLVNKIFQDWEIAPWELFIFEDRLLGEGTFSKVYLAKWRETFVVAKVIDPEFVKTKKSFVLRELVIMSKLHHPNIVQFLGFIDDPFIIILEYVSSIEFYRIQGEFEIILQLQPLAQIEEVIDSHCCYPKVYYKPIQDNYKLGSQNATVMKYVKYIINRHIQFNNLYLT